MTSRNGLMRRSKGRLGKNRIETEGGCFGKSWRKRGYGELSGLVTGEKTDRMK